MTDQLPLRKFGPTDLMVSPLCIGCAPLGDMPEAFAYGVSEDQALTFLRAAFRHPINFMDTAAAYGDGESERRIGLAIRELGGIPQGYVVGTKADRDLKTNDFSGEQMKRSIARSMQLLGVDHLPVVHLHDPEHTTFEYITQPGGALETLVDLKAQGAIGCLGIAGGPIDLMIKYVETGAFQAVITHNRYTLINRVAEPLIALASARGMAVLNAAPYGSGILAKGPDAYPRYAYQQAGGDLIEIVRKMDAICKEYGVPLAAAALQFSTRDPRITSTIIGMTKVERLDQSLQLALTPIPEEIWARLDALMPEQIDPEASREFPQY